MILIQFIADAEMENVIIRHIRRKTIINRTISE
jgi:hypothetical protein